MQKVKAITMNLSDCKGCFSYCNYTVVHKKTRHFYFFDNSWQILTDFHNFLTTIFSKELRNKNLLKFLPHVKSVAALPCET